MGDLKEFDAPNFKNSTFRLDRPSSYLLNKARRDEINGYSNLRKSMRSSTIYIGKLSFNTTEEQLFEIFSTCGTIKKIIMGLDKLKLTPTGFCFIIFDTPEGALNSVKYLNKTKVNGRSMEIDLDPGFEEGRQFGRGSDGGQKQQSTYQQGGFNGYRRGGNYRGGSRGNFRGSRGPRGGSYRGGYRDRPPRHYNAPYQPGPETYYNDEYARAAPPPRYEQQNEYLPQQDRFYEQQQPQQNYYQNDQQLHQHQHQQPDLPPHLANNSELPPHLANKDLPPHLQQ